MDKHIDHARPAPGPAGTHPAVPNQPRSRKDGLEDLEWISILDAKHHTRTPREDMEGFGLMNMWPRR